MKTFGRFAFLTCMSAVALLNAVALRAQTLPALAGTWNNAYFATPSQLTLERDAQQRVVNIPERNRFEIGTELLTVQSDGSFSMSGGSGNFSIGAQGVVLAVPSNGDSISFRVNVAQDVMIAASKSPAPQTSHELNFLVKAPTSVLPADVAGTWSLSIFDTPAEIMQTLGGPFNVVKQVSPTGGYSSTTGTMTLNTDGSLSGLADNAFTGTWSYEGGGRVATVIDGVFPLTFYINASKDAMVNVNEQSTAQDNFQEVIVMLKIPTSVTAAELAGSWKVNQLGTPSNLSAQYNLNGDLIALDGKDNFDTAQESLVFGNDGHLTGQIPNAATGTFASGANGIINLTISQTGEPLQNIAFRINAAKNTMISTLSSAGTQELLILTKAPNLPGFVDFGMQYNFNAGAMTFQWAASTGRILQYSTNLIQWFDLTATSGAHSYSASTIGQPPTFFRLIEPTAP